MAVTEHSDSFVMDSTLVARSLQTFNGPMPSLHMSVSEGVMKPLRTAGGLKAIKAFLWEAFLHPTQDSIVDWDTGTVLRRGKFAPLLSEYELVKERGP